MIEERVAGKVHLRDEALTEGTAEHGEVNVGWAPGIVVVGPRVGAWLDRDEPIRAICPAQAPAGAREVGIERRRMVISRMRIPTRCVRLPCLEQHTRYWAAGRVEHAAVHDDPLTKRFAAMLAGEIVI